MQGLLQLVDAELWKLQKSKRTRLVLITMGLLPWMGRFIAILVLKADANGIKGMFEGMEMTMPLFTSVVTAVLAISNLGSEFESGTLKTLIIQGVARWQILLAKAMAIVVISTLAVLLWGLGLFLASGNLGAIGWQEIQTLFACTLISFAYTGLIFAVAMSGRSSISTFFGLLIYLADVSMILTMGSPPAVGPTSSSWVARAIWRVGPFSILINGLNLVTVTVPADALPEIGLLILFGVTGLGFSMFVFSMQE